MIDSKIMAITKSILKDFGNTYFSDNGALKRNKAIEDLDAYTPLLMQALLANKLIHDTYTESIFVNGQNVEIFKLNQFIEMFTYKEYWQDSYTKFKNKIGLATDNKFIDESADVVLDFPFKDTLLKAGMTKDNQKNADEPFLNETIAKTEIDELLEPKIFSNTVMYDKNGEHTTSSFSNIDNLVIKGNNLIALHSLKQRYKEKVKLIFIDPPYNTGSDSFYYNDNFNHSTWLTFMKNRLTIAQALLKDDGVIAIQCDNNEQAYLKVLMDELWGNNSFVTTLHVQMSTTQGMKVRAAQNGNIVKNGEYIHIYSKDGHKNIAENPIYDIREDYDTHYMSYIKDDGTINPLNELYDYRYPKDLSNKQPLTLKSAFKQSNEFRETVRLHQAEIVRLHQAEIVSHDRVENIVNKKLEVGRYVKTSHQGKEYLLTLNSHNKMMQLLRLSDSWGKTDSYRSPEGLRKIRGDWWPDFYLDMGNIKKEGNANFSNGKKPERLISQIIKMLTKEHDLVLDFFMGSATTQAVAMKLNRRFIGIEQMDYIKSVSVERLKKVIAGEQGGISKDVNWQGGGSFVYAELREKNQSYLKDVQHAETAKQLEDVVNRMIDDDADFDFRVDMAKVLQDSEYQAMSLDEQKQLIIKTIDKNQLYYAYSDLEDSDVQALMSDSDIAFNKNFYGEREL